MTGRVRVLTGVLVIVVPLLFNLFFFLLQATFSYPDILRDPAAEILRRFEAGGPSLIALWYGFALTPALFIPTAVLFRRVFPEGPALLDLATPLAVVAGLVQVLGLVRRPFLVPSLAQAYLDPGSSEATRDAVVTVFAAFHQYAGVAVGEQLGYLFTALWTLVIAGAMLSAPLFRPWLGWVGMVAALGVLAGLLEPFGIEFAGTINAAAYIVWSMWLIVAGVFLLRAASSGVTPVPATVVGGVGLTAGMKQG